MDKQICCKISLAGLQLLLFHSPTLPSECLLRMLINHIIYIYSRIWICTSRFDAEDDTVILSSFFLHPALQLFLKTYLKHL